MSKPTPQSARYRESPIDVILGLIAVLLGSLGLYGARYNVEMHLGLTSGAGFTSAQVASLQSDGGTVRRQRAGDPVWEDLGDGGAITLHIGDSIFTGPEGLATIRYTDGQTARLLPNSLIVMKPEGAATADTSFSWIASWLKEMEGKSVISIKQGSIDVAESKDSAGLKVEIGSKRLTLAGRGGRAVQVSAENEHERLADIELSKAVPAFGAKINLAGEKEASAEAEGNVGFGWMMPPLPAKALPRLEVRGSRKIAVALKTGENSAALSLPSGHYEWRLACTSGAACHASRWLPFSVNVLAAPRLLFPGLAAKLEVKDEAPRKISFRWQENGTAAKGVIELTVLSAGAATKEIASPVGGGLIKLPKGSYRWRARDILSNGSLSPWSEAREFSVEEIAPPPPLLV
ncbi:MAG: hypothetical protein EOP11_14970, partial [Proteobacteria bacterium]